MSAFVKKSPFWVVGIAAGCMVAALSVQPVLGADRVVLCEYFNATW